MDAGSLTLLYRLVTLGSHSLLQYVSESVPWSAAKSAGALAQIMTMAREEREAAARLMRILQKKHLSPRDHGAYPSHYTTMNFVAIDYLLPKLIADNEKEVAEIEARLPQAIDEEAHALTQAYLDMKRRHLQALKEVVHHG